MSDKVTVLVTGGAGYIGSHTLIALLDAGYQVVVVDNLVTGDRRLVPDGAPFIEANAGDVGLVSQLMRDHRIGAVIHFAGSIVVPESVADPLKYYQNNSCISRNLIEACVAAEVELFVLSSTAAVYGIPAAIPIPETAPLQPVSPYGSSKLVTEWILRDAAAAHSLRYVTLRYFNVAGADSAMRTGQSTREATHLIKVACQAALGLRDHLQIFGNDYDTADGTCVRDYIHVSDLATAHVATLAYLEGGGESQVLNLGYGRGFSVKEVLDTLEEETCCRVRASIVGRRPGDPPALVADPSATRATLAWTPRYEDLRTIVRTAYEWEEKVSRGDHRPSRLSGAATHSRRRKSLK